jgi:NAD(P)-dependent dehydrogenase (short-subunit alcohol dehydrogenase family)
VSGCRLDGAAVTVVGASRGIGAAAAVACAEAGAESVTLLGRSERELATVATAVGEAGARPSVILCDVTSVAEIERGFAEIERIDVLVQSAGGNRPEPFLDVSAETFDRLFALNVRGVFFTVQEAVRKMAKGSGGSIVLVSSQMGHVGAANRTVYCATKHAIEGLTKALAVEAAGDGVRVVSVAPTFVRTEMTASQLDDPVIGPKLLAQIPQGRFGTPEQVADAIVFAASPAASMVTGSSILVDGGWTAR